MRIVLLAIGLISIVPAPAKGGDHGALVAQPVVDRMVAQKTGVRKYERKWECKSPDNPKSYVNIILSIEQVVAPGAQPVVTEMQATMTTPEALQGGFRRATETNEVVGNPIRSTRAIDGNVTWRKYQLGEVTFTENNFQTSGSVTWGVFRSNCVRHHLDPRT